MALNSPGLIETPQKDLKDLDASTADVSSGDNLSSNTGTPFSSTPKRTPTIQPLPSTPSSANISGKGLQGRAKVLRNGVADLTNLVDQWDELSSKSYSQFENLLDHVSSYEDREIARFNEVFDQTLSDLANQLSLSLDRLQRLVESASQIVQRMDKCQDAAAARLEFYAINESLESPILSQEPEVLFHSWKVPEFVESCGKIYDAYSQQVS